MISSWRLAGSYSRFVVGSGWSCSLLSFLSLSRLCAHATPVVAERVTNIFILSSFSWPPPIVRYHRPVPLPHLLSVDCGPLCFTCWLAFLAQNGYLLRSVRTLSPLLYVQCPNYFARLADSRFFCGSYYL